MSHTPFCDALLPLFEREGRFHMPGHKGNPAASDLLRGILRCDITEIPGAGDLSHPSGALAESEANMTRAYQSGATLYSAFGSTSCILAMLTLYLRPGQSVVMARGCHAAAVRGLALLDARPVWVLPGAGGQPTPADIDAALAGSSAKAVYLTSPDYYGRMADIPAIAAVCRAHGAALLVDNAHGAHLAFIEPNLHPIRLGADATADSAHKTLPCVTPAAMLHLADASRAGQARAALNLYSSTSPSYLVLYTLDYTAGLLLDGGLDFTGAARRLAQALAASGHLLRPSRDPLKACLVPALGGWPAQAVSRALADAGLTPELDDGQQIVLMASPYNTQQDFDRLQAALAPFTSRPPLALPPPWHKLPAVACPPREALFGDKTRVPLAQAAGRVCAGIDAPCPPGVPLVMPGELIPPEMLPHLQAGGISALDVLK